jgi:hypothetical protein
MLEFIECSEFLVALKKNVYNKANVDVYRCLSSYLSLANLSNTDHSIEHSVGSEIFVKAYAFQVKKCIQKCTIS